MRPSTILHKILFHSQTNIHGHHINFLGDALNAVCYGARLTCASIGRHIKSTTTTKHNIKRVNYMLGSACLYNTKTEIYKLIAHTLLISRPRPVISIDWSSSNPSKRFHILRATLTVRDNGGRGLTIYEESHPESKLGNAAVHKRFLATLNELIPINCNPIILTDAGFHSNWFKEVRHYNWDYIGRVRGMTKCKLEDGDNWISCKSLYDGATNKPRFIGALLLSKKTRYKCNAYLFKSKPKNRKRITVKGMISQGSASKKNANRNKEPWFLVTSLSGGIDMGNAVVNYYKKRMQIEETFRDTKSTTYGFGLKQHRTKSSERIDILLIISSLAHLVTYILGFSITRINKHRTQQANTIKKRKVLSFINLGVEYCRLKFCELTEFEVGNTLLELAHD